MHRIWFVLLIAAVGASLSACVVEERGSSPRTVVYSEHRNHGQERRAEVHERNAERKHEKGKR